MNIRMRVERECWPIAGSFTISRGSRTQADVIVVTIERSDAAGRGECVPYGRYGETMDSVAQQIAAAGPRIEAGASRHELLSLMPPGAARNAVDCALWDLEAKSGGHSVAARVCSHKPAPIITAVTISLGTPEEMRAAAGKLRANPLIKAKLGGEGDALRIAAVCEAAPHSRIILDANEAWTQETLPGLMDVAARHGVALIEQPLPAGKDGFLSQIPHSVPVCADESAHVTSGLAALKGLYECVNIKLDKAGGLTEAMRMRSKAHELGFTVMAGCMVGTSLAMAPAVLLAQDCEYADLDGPLILTRDRDHGLAYAEGRVSPPSPMLWG